MGLSWASASPGQVLGEGEEVGYGLRERGRRPVGPKVKEGGVLVGQLKGFEPKGEGDVFPFLI